MCTVRNDCHYRAGIGPKKLYAPVFTKPSRLCGTVRFAGWHIGVRAPFAYLFTNILRGSFERTPLHLLISQSLDFCDYGWLGKMGAKRWIGRISINVWLNCRRRRAAVVSTST